MKIIFKQECRDKNNGAMYKVGEVHVFEDERAKEILKSGYADLVEEVKETKNDVAQEKKTLQERLDNGEIIELNSLTKSELVNLAKEQGVSVRGSKEDIIERLLANQDWFEVPQCFKYWLYELVIKETLKRP